MNLKSDIVSFHQVPLSTENHMSYFQRGLCLRKWNGESMYHSATDMYVCIRSILEFTGNSASRMQCKVKKIKIS